MYFLYNQLSDENTWLFPVARSYNYTILHLLRLICFDLSILYNPVWLFETNGSGSGISKQPVLSMHKILQQIYS